MSIDLNEINLAYWYAEVEKHRCGYCTNPVGNMSYGMTVQSLNVNDYQDLIDRGWRRSGTYCYKPIMDQTCCPQYTIKCDALSLSLSKSQKKVIKKLNKFLVDGALVIDDRPQSSSGDADGHVDMFVKDKPKNVGNEFEKLAREFNNRAEQGDGLVAKPQSPNKDCGDVINSQTRVKGAPSTGLGADTSKPPSKKAKLMRLERKKEKLLQRGMSLEKLNAHANQQKSLEDFLRDLPTNAKHKLKLKLVATSNRGIEWDSCEKVEFELYKKYQMMIHNDPADKCTLKGFLRFLVASPLKHVKFSNNEVGPGFGTFHQQYWLDNKLIAVGVIDILPKCVSSVYFFYDPDYRSLTLGTYGSLRELEFTRSLHQVQPSINQYYMGFYIHSCPKMRYKGKLSPSFLLCPETYVWVALEKCIRKLDVSKYSRLNEDIDGIDENATSDTDIDKLKLASVFDQYSIKEFRAIRKNCTQTSIFENIGMLIGRKTMHNFIFEVFN